MNKLVFRRKKRVEKLIDFEHPTLVGAWIETRQHWRGFFGYAVAPLVGAWIETFANTAHTYRKGVAPLVGAWIETGNTLKINN